MGRVTLLRMTASIPLIGIPGMSLRADVDLLKRDPETGQQVVVSTTRPCPGCGEPLVGLIVADSAGVRECATCRGLQPRITTTGGTP